MVGGPRWQGRFVVRFSLLRLAATINKFVPSIWQASQLRDSIRFVFALFFRKLIIARPSFKKNSFTFSEEGRSNLKVFDALNCNWHRSYGCKARRPKAKEQMVDGWWTARWIPLWHAMGWWVLSEEVIFIVFNFLFNFRIHQTHYLWNPTTPLKYFPILFLLFVGLLLLFFLLLRNGKCIRKQRSPVGPVSFPFIIFISLQKLLANPVFGLYGAWSR